MLMTMWLFSSVSVTCAFTFRFFFNDTATTEIYTLSLHDALPISDRGQSVGQVVGRLGAIRSTAISIRGLPAAIRSEEHTSELQSQFHLVCRLLLEKKNKCVLIVVARVPHVVRDLVLLSQRC